METILIKALQLILSLSILVIVHECGHFIFAKIFKVRVEKFYLFFNPWFSLFKYKPKKSETEYGIGWLPLGGYVKIAGMIDESMDKKALEQPPQPWEFRTKPAWQRLLIMVGGVIMNFLLAFLIYSLIVFKWGDNYVPIDKTPLYFSQCAHQAGFQDGDIVLKADSTNLTRYDDLDLFRILKAKEVLIVRNGQEQTLRIPENFKSQFLASKTPFTDFQFTQIDSVLPGKNAEKAGLKAGDKVLSVNGLDATAFGVFKSLLNKNKNSKVSLVVLRDGEQLTIPVQVEKVDDEGQIGFVPFSRQGIVISDKYNFFASFPAGTYVGLRKMHAYVLQMGLIFTKEGAQSLGGFGAIASIFPKQWDWPSFWSMTAFLSIILGIMNIIPIPALDGGHVMFLLYEVVSGRKPSDKFLERAQMVGMALLIALLLYANGMDIFRAITKQ